MNASLWTALRQYDELGFDTLPLIGGSKKPYSHAWQYRTSYRLWQNTPEGLNVGIRAGGLASVAIIDCDDSMAFENVTDCLATLGYRGDSYPVIQTASREGKHIYITFLGGLSGNARKLAPGVGAGEFRYGPGAYVVAPPSVVGDDGSYFLLSGGFDVRPSLRVTDILPLLDNHEIASTRVPTPSRKALALLNGRNTDSYSSRSEAEQSIIASLVNSGYTFEEVLDLFNRHRCAGKYSELKAKNAKNADRWLMRSYDEAARWTAAHDSKARQMAETALAWADSRPWPGRTGAVDRLIYMAHAQIASGAGRFVYAAACRDLAERASVSHMTAARATRRLCASGLLIKDKKAVADCANLYQLNSAGISLHSLRTSTVRKCNAMSTSDAFRQSGLGKSAAEVYMKLLEGPATAGELAKQTGRHISTVRRVLDRLSKLADPLTGETLPMVTCDHGKTYRALATDLDRVADAVGTAGMGERQRREHAKERRLHAQSLERGRGSRRETKQV